MWLFRDMLHSTKLKSFSSINFLLFTQCIRGPYFGDPWHRRMSAKDWSEWRWVFPFYGVETWLLLLMMCGTKRLNAYSDYTRPVRYFRSAWVYVLLLSVGKIRSKGKTSLRCSYSCRYSMTQNAMAYLCEMAPITKLKCAPFLLIYVLYA